MKHTSKYSLESLSYAKIGDAAAVLLIRSVNCSSIISAILWNKIVLLQHMRFIPGKAECWNSSLAKGGSCPVQHLLFVTSKGRKNSGCLHSFACFDWSAAS